MSLSSIFDDDITIYCIGRKANTDTGWFFFKEYDKKLNMWTWVRDVEECYACFVLSAAQEKEKQQRRHGIPTHVLRVNVNTNRMEIEVVSSDE